MPTITDLLKAEGVEITPELAAKIPTLVEASDEVRGLVTAKQELHEWKQSNVDKVANFESMELKSIEDLKAREELAIANKDFQAQIEKHRD